MSGARTPPEAPPAGAGADLPGADLPGVDRAAVVAEANRAPSVHNVQPVRWAFAPGEVRLRLDPARSLRVGDPEGRDAALSLGCALEGTRIALARRGLAGEVEVAEDGAGATALLRPRAAPGARAGGERDHALMARRRTHRLGFASPRAGDRDALRRWARGRDDVALATDDEVVAALAARADAASLGLLRDDAYRAELVAWMRLGGRDPRAGRDGLAAAALGLGRLEAAAARVALAPAPFRLLDRLGLAGPVTSERAAGRGAAAIVALTIGAADPRPRADVAAGVAHLRAALDLVALGLQAWPMGALADDPTARAEAGRALGLAPGRVARVVLRVGRPAREAPAAARIPAAELID